MKWYFCIRFWIEGWFWSDNAADHSRVGIRSWKERGTTNCIFVFLILTVLCLGNCVRKFQSVSVSTLDFVKLGRLVSLFNRMKVCLYFKQLSLRLSPVPFCLEIVSTPTGTWVGYARFNPTALRGRNLFSNFIKGATKFSIILVASSIFVPSSMFVPHTEDGECTFKVPS